jgi:signal transduction histidine kinase
LRASDHALIARVASFERRLAAFANEPRPVLVVRLPELERVAWRRGLRAARALERRATAAFSTAVSRVLRADDLVGHDGGTDVFVAALVAPTRDGNGVFAPVDIRSALARIAATMEAATRLDVRTGWTTYDRDADAGTMDSVVERALERGLQERERYTFFSSLGHELRTPLSSIRGYLETLMEPDVDPGTRERFVRVAFNESLRLSRLVEGMFEISLLDLAGSASPAIGSLAQALEAAHDACAASALERTVGIVAGDVPAVEVAIDTDRLTLVLVNLIDNAVKHGRPGGGVFVGVELDDRRFVRITVDDDGPGIAAIDRERVFALGERAATSAKGTGIGLALVRLMLERARGRIELEGSPLGGARFVITLPRA